MSESPIVSSATTPEPRCAVCGHEKWEHGTAGCSVCDCPVERTEIPRAAPPSLPGPPIYAQPTGDEGFDDANDLAPPLSYADAVAIGKRVSLTRDEAAFLVKAINQLAVSHPHFQMVTAEIFVRLRAIAEQPPRGVAETPTDTVTCPCGGVCKLDDSPVMGKWGEDGPTVEYRSVGWKCPECREVIFTREQADQRTINLLRASVEWLQKDREPLNDLVNALLTHKYIQTLPKTRSIKVDRASEPILLCTCCMRVYGARTTCPEHGAALRDLKEGATP